MELSEAYFMTLVQAADLFQLQYWYLQQITMRAVISRPILGGGEGGRGSKANCKSYLYLFTNRNRPQSQSSVLGGMFQSVMETCKNRKQDKDETLQSQSYTYPTTKTDLARGKLFLTEPPFVTYCAQFSRRTLSQFGVKMQYGFAINHNMFLPSTNLDERRQPLLPFLIIYIIFN